MTWTRIALLVFFQALYALTSSGNVFVAIDPDQYQGCLFGF